MSSSWASRLSFSASEARVNFSLPSLRRSSSDIGAVPIYVGDDPREYSDEPLQLPLGSKTIRGFGPEHFEAHPIGRQPCFFDFGFEQRLGLVVAVQIGAIPHDPLFKPSDGLHMYRS